MVLLSGVRIFTALGRHGRHVTPEHRHPLQTEPCAHEGVNLHALLSLDSGNKSFSISPGLTVRLLHMTCTRRSAVFAINDTHTRRAVSCFFQRACGVHGLSVSFYAP